MSLAALENGQADMRQHTHRQNQSGDNGSGGPVAASSLNNIPSGTEMARILVYPQKVRALNRASKSTLLSATATGLWRLDVLDSPLMGLNGKKSLLP